jgi:LmbE family N-acetylglucosaminyl deacetylase
MLDHIGPESVLFFVGAHPDDETTVGALLAYAADRCRRVIVVSLTRGQSGVNLRPTDLTRTLADVRSAELDAATRVLGCEAVTFDYLDGITMAHPEGLAVAESEAAAVARWKASGVGRMKPEDHLARWTRASGDPSERLRKLFRERGATAVLTLEPGHGFTGHPEHIATAEAARRAILAYQQDTGRTVPLFHVHPPADAVEGSRLIPTEELNRRGGRDYAALAWASFACYESQYGTGAACQDRHMHDWVKGCRLRSAPAG